MSISKRVGTFIVAQTIVCGYGAASAIDTGIASSAVEACVAYAAALGAFLSLECLENS